MLHLPSDDHRWAAVRLRRTIRVAASVRGLRGLFAELEDASHNPPSLVLALYVAGLSVQHAEGAYTHDTSLLAAAGLSFDEAQRLLVAAGGALRDAEVLSGPDVSPVLRETARLLLEHRRVLALTTFCLQELQPATA